MVDVVFEPMYSVAERVERREVSAVELAEAALGQVNQWSERLNPFITPTPDLALEMARAADAEIAAGNYRGPLHGIAVVLKDLLETDGVRTTGGSKVLADWVPERDATVVTKMREAGAVFIGKTGMPEFAAQPVSLNPHYGNVSNPWNLAYDTGGSSSGTAAAIAAGMAWCGPGSDTGGSIRMPAAATGLVGLKPTWGRVSLRGVIPLSATFDHIGPMARTVRDAAILMNVLAGYDDEDGYCRDMPVDDCLSEIEVGVKGLRIAVIPDDGKPVDPVIAGAFTQGLKTLEDAGARLEDVSVPIYRDDDVDSSLFHADFYAHHGRHFEERPDDLSDYVRDDLAKGQTTTGAEVMESMRELRNLIHQTERVLRPFDLAVSPTLAVFPPPVGEPSLPMLRMTAPWNATGWPVASVPLGLSEAFLPIGFQVIGKPWTESLVLRAARAIERNHALTYPPSGLQV